MTTTVDATHDDADRRPQAPRAAILARAVEIIAAEGLPAVTPQRMADETSLTHHAVLHHFESAEQLTVHAFRTAADIDFGTARDHVADAPTPADALTALVDYVVDADELSTMWVDAWSMGRGNAALAAEALLVTAQWLDFLERILLAGKEAGQFHIEDPAVAARRLLTIIDGLDSQKMVRAVPKHELRHIARSYVDSLRTSFIEQAKLAALGTLTAGVAHEMKNPLNFVVNFTELNLELCAELREGMPEELEDVVADVESNLKLVLNHTNRALSVMATMLDVGRSSYGEAQPCGLNRIAERSMKLAEHSWRINHRDARCGLHLELDDSEPVVMGFEGDLVQVVINLVMNGLDSASCADDGEVHVRVRHDDESAYIDVTDNGAGIDARTLPRIFEPFFTTKHRSGGTGLGLSISKDIVDNRHQGALTVDSTTGAGARFCVRLPSMVRSPLA